MRRRTPASQRLIALAVACAFLRASSAGAVEGSMSAGQRGGDNRSDIEKHVARAIASAYTRDSQALDEEYLFFRSLDRFLRSHGQPSTGLSDNLLDLTVSTVADQDAFLRGQKEILEAGPDSELRERVKYRMRNDVSSAHSLLATDRYNRFTYLFNTFVRPLTLMTVGYFPALIDAGVATLLNVDRFTELSVEEKKALVLYKRFLEKYPTSDQAKILRLRATKLNRKRLKKSCRKEIAEAKMMLAKGDFWQARQHYKNALAYWPESRRAAEGLSLARELEMSEARLKRASLEPAEKAKEFPGGSQEKDYREILYAALGGSPEMVIYEAEDYILHYPQGKYAGTARYAITAACDMKRVHERAKELMREIAVKYRGSHIGAHAAAYLENPDYNLLRAFERSKRRRRLQSARYVLLGPEFTKSNIILGTSRLITQGLQALATLGLFNVVAMVARGVSATVRNPIPETEIIDSAVRYLRRYPESPVAPDIHLLLARAYMKRRNLAKAAYHFEVSGRVSEKKCVRLREKAAKQYMDFANATESRQEKIRCYEAILDDYPQTRAAAKALEQLALLEREKVPLFELHKETIAGNPILFKLTELHLGPHLVDGDRSNGEVASRGIYSLQRGKVTIVYEEAGSGERERTVDVNYEAYKGLMAFADEVDYRRKLRKGLEAPAGGRFPVELRGSVGDDGVFVYPRLKARPYRGKDLYLYQ